ncbi:hypothetical protein [Acidipila rosea]|uniref:Outer membrane protein with beta-barrel domain n=1 Tax=Acidipila rosea TaxID=768535 RepID=A0A4V2PV21_9BACT|nr:hypothetical protein [Acidipila rosea]TCK72651.1 hypothetical protein C7378_2237 [Acidipila rosea]
MKQSKLLVLALAGLVLSFAAVPVRAQKALHNDDAALSFFGQFSNSVNGNGISLHSGDSLGVQGAFRHTYHWWLGYEANYGYTRFSEYYSTHVYSFQHNLHEIGGAYLVQAPSSFAGLHPFATGGVSVLIFSPTLNGGQQAPWQARPAVTFGAGVNHPILRSNFGVRAQYRALFYKAPDFGEASLNTGSFRMTSEPTIGFYLKF